MDLVVSYCSDDSECEEVKYLKDIKMTAVREIDVIELDVSDEEDQPAGTHTNTSLKTAESKERESSNNDKSNSREAVECISIHDSDVEKLTVTDENDSEKSSKTMKSDDVRNSPEKIDFLNLESSDTEDEQLNVQNSVNSLLNSAAIMNDIPLGPNKFSKEADSSLLQAVEFIPEKETESQIRCSSISTTPESTSLLDKASVRNLSRSSNESPQLYDSSRKRFKTDSPHIEAPEHTKVVDPNDHNEEQSVTSAHIYRKDSMVTEAYLKNVVCRIPHHLAQTYIGHTNVVTALSWCVPQYSHLLLSASADCTLKIWDIFCKNPVQCFKNNSGLKAAKWSLDGEQVVTGGYGKKAHVFDVLSGQEIVAYNVYNYVTSMEMHPFMEDIFLCGTRNAILGFDLRVDTQLPIRTFFSKCEEVLDIAFLDENEFICSTNVVSHDSADRTIMVWDFGSGAILSNQIFLERYTCPSIKVHPHDSSFVAQTNGDYVSVFSSLRPYKIKNKRYMGHKVSGFGIECDISPDGKYLVSGDANGEVYFYNYVNTNVVHKMTAKSNVPTNRLRWHPALPSTIAIATWDGHLQIWK